MGIIAGVVGFGETREVIPPDFFARIRNEVVLRGAAGACGALCGAERALHERWKGLRCLEDMKALPEALGPTAAKPDAPLTVKLRALGPKPDAGAAKSKAPEELSPETTHVSLSPMNWGVPGTTMPLPVMSMALGTETGKPDAVPVPLPVKKRDLEAGSGKPDTDVAPLQVKSRAPGVATAKPDADATAGSGAKHLEAL